MRLADKIAFLSKPASYPRKPGDVEVKETHTAVVFLTDDRAYKLKKPVRFPFLDATSLESRAHLCREEVRLNAELAGDVYLGVITLNRREDGGLALNGAGEIVDWLVEMRRLPEAQFLINRIAGQSVTEAEIRDLGACLSRFYGRQRANPACDLTYAEHLVRESQINREHLLAVKDTVAYPALDALLAAACQTVDDHMPEIRARIEQGFVVEGHGDLRPEHICLVSPPVLFDRLEFDPAMRMIDIYDEVNYLGLECDLLGAGWIGPHLLAHLEATIGHAPTPGLLKTYGVFRLLLRARLSIDHLRDPHPRDTDKWIAQARKYLEAATGLHDSLAVQL